MVGGAYRGPVGVGRQRRTIRFVQGLLVLIAVGLLFFAGYALGEANGFEDGRRADALDGVAQKPATSQTLVLALLGLGAFAAALLLQTEGGVRLLTPKKLLELERSGGSEPIAMDEQPQESSESGSPRTPAGPT